MQVLTFALAQMLSAPFDAPVRFVGYRRWRFLALPLAQDCSVRVSKVSAGMSLVFGGEVGVVSALSAGLVRLRRNSRCGALLLLLFARLFFRLFLVRSFLRYHRRFL